MKRLIAAQPRRRADCVDCLYNSLIGRVLSVVLLGIHRIGAPQYLHIVESYNYGLGIPPILLAMGWEDPPAGCGTFVVSSLRPATTNCPSGAVKLICSVEG